MPRRTARLLGDKPLEVAERNSEPADGPATFGKDWRRRLQNRLSQQTYRRRQQVKRAVQLQAESEAQELKSAIPPAWKQVSGPDLDFMIQLIREQQRYIKETSECRLARPETYELLALLESAAYRSYIRCPSTDHRLTLVRLNVFRAFERNISALGYTREWMTDDAISRFSVCGPVKKDLPESLPAGLQPTALQKSLNHHPWLDFFPFAHLRDELIREENSIDDSQLCRDLMGFWTMPTVGENCMLVWGDPWEPMNWEITEAFLQKWGFLVKGCPEIIWSSNYWRQQRGEPKLKWKVTFK